MINGVINVYKEKGFTSHDVVAKLRGILKQKKIGHTGTLDPDAEGVLPVCLGSGTKLCDMLTDKDKEYVAVVRLGVTTDTQDLTGKILNTQPVNVTEEELIQTVMSFLGRSMQVPPMYSALKVNGQKLYELARKGQEVERKPREIQVFELEIMDISLPEFTMRVKCSKGTYIRTLCNDIGEKLGCGAAMKNLLRTKVSTFLLEDAVKLSEIESLRDEGKLADVIIPVDCMFEHLKEVMIKEEFRKLVENGNSFMKKHIKENPDMFCEDNEQVRIYDEQKRFYGIYAYKIKENRFVPVKMFLER